MPVESDLKKSVGRRLTRRKQHDPRPLSPEMPEKFKDGADANEDVCTLHGNDVHYMNQSIFSMIAAAGSRADFRSRFDEDSSDAGDESDEEDTQDKDDTPRASQDHADGRPTVMPSEGKPQGQGKKLSELLSLPRLHSRTSKGKSRLSQTVSGPFSEASGAEDKEPEKKESAIYSRDAPVMSRMIQAQAKQAAEEASEREQAAVESGKEPPADVTEPKATITLAEGLRRIFGYEDPEEVLAEYPCWLLQSVLLQGYLYITRRHICFYAYLPKKSDVVVRSGHLSKRDRGRPTYQRYWFVLKGDVLSYYDEPVDIYFPSGNIDLRYGISANLDGHEHEEKARSFSVVTDQRTYHLRADSAPSAKEWVRMLQKVIFRSHNDGDSVKISIPIENVIDIDDSSVLELAETVKIRVIESDETYAIDEYFFSFFRYAKDALRVLRTVVESMPAQNLAPESQRRSSAFTEPASPSSPRGRSQEPRPRTPQGKQIDSLSESLSPVLHDRVRATLSPRSRATSRAASSLGWGQSHLGNRAQSMDVNRERESSSSSVDFGRRSISTTRYSVSGAAKEPQSPSTMPHESSDSFVHSLDRDIESSPAVHSIDDTQASASQILDRSDVFHSPTIPSHPREGDANWKGKGKSDEGNRTIKFGKVKVHSPSRSQIRRTLGESDKENFGDVSDSETGSEIHSGQMNKTGSTPTLQELVRAGAYPLQRAAGFAEYLKSHSKRMTGLLASESMGYVEKVSGMWAGGRRHYSEGGPSNGDEVLDEVDEDTGMGPGDRFRAHFALSPSEKLQASYFGYLLRVLPLYGKIYISDRKFCFRSLLPGTKTKLILPLKDIENVDKEKGFRFGYSGLVVVVKGHEEIFFEFSHPDSRDDCTVTMLQKLESVRYLKESGILTQEEEEEAEIAKAEHRLLMEARREDHDLMISNAHSADAPPILFDDPRVSIINFKPTQSLRITCLTIGSRGDVQPYIALCKGLLAEGHKPRIATHREFEPWVREHGIDFAPVEGDPAELMRICVEYGMFTYSFLKEASLKFRGWIDQLLRSAWMACQDSDLLIESPSAMAGIHIAEALQIPYFRAFSMPWTRTRAYPHAFAVPQHKMGGAYNYITYVMFDNVFWKAIAGQVNRWRKTELKLPSTSLDKLQANKVPFLYSFSPSVVVPPLDYSDWIRVTGYWFLNEGADWKPPQELTDFVRKAREDGKKIVYIGFGSIVVSDPAALTKTVIDSVRKADVRCILSKGWSDRLGNKDPTAPEMPLPPEILQIKSAPHDWLFTQIDAAAHHGGAGTTGASLRAGLPTIVKPFFGDQFFFGSRVEDLGVGICLKRLNVSVLSRALWEATHSERIIVKARALGEQIRKEDGVGNAIQAIYRDMEYAKSLIKRHGVPHTDETYDDSEESWTFIGDESDPELTRRIADWEPPTRQGKQTASTTAPTATPASGITSMANSKTLPLGRARS
ncbi:glycosyltransferase family 1 protein [Xylona heveae TC161]|uniref:Sterol 3-beta-glucosyltransferase n=1 Tax=Xylona heveae (strain CBS 132557 / TC161) TaxID=1328760 RepID=A0A165G8V1_XYLHT|nr:glycosyltransferase family 1 protein [Xylona heveae TC161]KZF21882.1 glycosyltransferase family 1 protein [Xylona heveae TC161]